MSLMDIPGWRTGWAQGLQSGASGSKDFPTAVPLLLLLPLLPPERDRVPQEGLCVGGGGLPCGELTEQPCECRREPVSDQGPLRW